MLVEEEERPISSCFLWNVPNIVRRPAFSQVQPRYQSDASYQKHLQHSGPGENVVERRQFP
jgi:hypothetical protein